MSVEPQGYADDPLRSVKAQEYGTYVVWCQLSCGHRVSVADRLPRKKERCRKCGEKREAAA